MRRLTSTLRTVRRRIQRERLLQGVALLFGGFVMGSVLSSLLLARTNFSDDALFWIRLIGGTGLLAVVLKYILKPVSRPPSDVQVARFLEERHPALQDRLSTAVEVSHAPTTIHAGIRRLLERDAWDTLKRFGQPRFYRPQASLFWSLLALASLMIFAYLFFTGPEAYPYSLHKLFAGWIDRDKPPLYSIVVTPGDAKVGKRADVQVRARLQGFNSQSVKLFARYENAPAWEQALMQPDHLGSEFLFLFFDVRDRIEYYVEAEGIRSDTYTLQVADIPRVEKLKIVLSFPRYTGLKNAVLEESGDIRALAGTRAEFVIQTDQPVKSGAIKLEKGGEVSLRAAGPRQLQGSLQVKEDDYYRIQLQDQENFWNPGSDEYLIEALRDQSPVVSFTRPGRDQKVTNIEEVFTELKAEDDYGITALELRFSVNGGPEQQAKLDYPRGSRSFSASHTFYLEEFDLQPGDFVSYYAKAADATSSATTDIYFFEVEPYDREYYQSQQAGMPAGASGENNAMLSRRQKEIIAATFKLRQQKQPSPSDEFQENSQTLALVQQRLQGEAQAIVDRIQRRGAAALDPRLRKMGEYLAQAIVHMDPAQRHLNQLNPSEALPEEQKSLQQLLRAEALLKEIQVAFAQSQAAGGGNPSPEELANLVDLELDKKKNQYETLQQNQALSREQALDEALEKLKELAKRQEQAAERRRRQAMQSSSASAGSSQDQLIDEVERLARELERLSRQQRENSSELADIGRQLRQAARDMRQSQAGSGGAEEAQMRAQRALERLKQAEGALAQQRQNQMAQGVQRLKEDSERLVEKQKEVVDKIGELQEQQKAGKIEPSFLSDTRRLLRQKSELQQDVHRLEGDLHQSARQMASQQPEASRKLKQAGLDVRDRRIPEKMQEGSELLSRGWTELARQREGGVLGELRDLADKIAQAERALSQGNQSNAQEKLQRALHDVGSLVEDLESLKERADQARREGEPPGTAPDRSGRTQTNPQGRPSEQAAQASQAAQPSQQSSQAQSSGQPSATAGPQTSATQAGVINNAGGVNPRQIRREWQERIQDAEAIRRALENNPRLAQDLSALVREMRRLDLERLFSDPEEIARLKAQVIDGFRQLELEINRALQQESGSLLRLVSEDEVPPEFRDRVEEYYRALSSKKKP